MKYSNYQFTETAIQSYLAILSKFRLPTSFPTQPTGRGTNKIPYVQCNSKVAITELQLKDLAYNVFTFVFCFRYPLSKSHTFRYPLSKNNTLQKPSLYGQKMCLSSLLLPPPLDPFIYTLILNQLIVISIIVTKLFFHFCNGRVNILLIILNYYYQIYHWN